MDHLYLVIAIAIASSVLWAVKSLCIFCGNRITPLDKMYNGRIRWRKKGTQMPVCSRCAKRRRGEVE